MLVGHASTETSFQLNRVNSGNFILWLAVLGFALLVVLCTIAEVDLYLSTRFYDPNGAHRWFLQEAIPWIWLYHYGQYPAILMAFGAAFVFLRSFVQHSWAGYRRRCLILVLSVALGPGLLVNGILKPYWGRPRPREIVQLGGSLPYLPWWQPGGPGTGESFPAGHASIAYILIAGASVISSRRRAGLRLLVFMGGLGYGTLMGVARIIQGGHFASDVLWAGALMCIVVIALQEVLGVSSEEVTECGSQEQSNDVQRTDG